MQRRALRVSKGNSVAKSGGGKLGCHAGIDRVTDDPVRANVLNRAKKELSFIGPMLRDIDQPKPVKAVGGEVAEHEIVVDGRPGFSVQATFFRKDTPQSLLGTQPPHPPFRGFQP